MLLQSGQWTAQDNFVFRRKLIQHILFYSANHEWLDDPVKTLDDKHLLLF